MAVLTRALTCIAACSILAALPSDATAARTQKPVATKRPAQAKPIEVKPVQATPTQAKPTQARATQARYARSKATKSKQAKAKPTKGRPTKEAASEPPKPTLPGELGVLKQAIGLVRAGKFSDAAPLIASFEDPTARKLVEWVHLRNGDSTAAFDRYAEFIRMNPGWPAVASLRRRAETRLWQERRDAATVRSFTGGQPTSVMGRFALARVMLEEGDRAGAEQYARATWRGDELSEETESAVLAAFGDMITRSDHLARMDRRIGRKDLSGAMRAARRLGDGYVAIVKACSASQRNSDETPKLVGAVPPELHGNLGYILCRIHYLLLHDGVATAAQLALAASPETQQDQDNDEWWRERRTLARKLLDSDQAKTAYDVVAGAGIPANAYYRAELHFMAGWIALRFLSDPARALEHFGHIDDDTSNPVVLARGSYWRGRAYEATGETEDMLAEFRAAARYSTAYYGQLARARLGLHEAELRPAPQTATMQLAAGGSDVVHAAELLYAIGERELALSFMTDQAERGDDAVQLAALAELAVRNNDARAVLLIGKGALARGLPLEVYAYPAIGVPHYTPFGAGLDRSIVFSIVRTESEFNQQDRSPANAVGLMQVTPEAGRDTAKRFNVRYDWDRLVSDPVYNTQMGAAELEALLKEYRGSYIMSFAGYNAGRGRVQTWVRQYGDPRHATVDPVDWVERIPFAETRNYVQRVMENLAVYRVRLRNAPGETPTPVALEPEAAPKTVGDAPAEIDGRAREAVAR